MALWLFRAIVVTCVYFSTAAVASAGTGILEEYIKPTGSTLGAKLFNLFQRPAGFDKSYAIVIGIGKYSSFPQLDAPSSDALRVRDFLRDEEDFDYIVTMTDEKATRENIEKYMDSIIPSRIKSNDRFLFYFSGHGTTRQFTGWKRGYLMLSASVKDQWDTMIDMPRVSEWAQNVEGAKHTLFLIDACFGGLTATQAKVATGAMTLERLLMPSHYLMTAGAEDEESYSYGGESLFTSAFLSSARGEGDNKFKPLISLDDIIGGIHRQIDAKRAEIHDLKMTPQLYRTKLDDNAGEFFFVNKTRQANRGGSTKPPRGVLHVLAIGVDRFGDKAGWLKLNYAAEDAHDVAAALLDSQKGAPDKASLYLDVKLTYLQNGEADSAAVLDALDAMAQSMAMGAYEDVAVILVSSHGEMIDGQFYLIPYGFDPGSQGRSISTAVSASEFAKKVGALAAHGKVLLLLDACHSGAVGPQEWARDPDAKVLKDAMDMGNVSVLSSSVGNEISLEDPTLQHGAFTQAFLDAIAGSADPFGRGLISTLSLANAMDEELRRLTNGKQHLGMQINFDEDVFVVSR